MEVIMSRSASHGNMVPSRRALEAEKGNKHKKKGNRKGYKGMIRGFREGHCITYGQPSAKHPSL